MNEKRIKALKEKRNAIIEQMEAMTAAAIDENGEERAFTEEEQAEFTRLENSAKALKNTIEAEERARELEMKPAEENKPEDKEMNAEERAMSEERAFADFLRGVTSEDRADVNMTVSGGQATIPTSIANKIIEKVYDICPVAQKATRYNVKGTLTIPYYPASAATDITMAYASEFSALESTSGSFNSITLQGFLAGVLTKVSESLVNNSNFDIVGFVIEHMAEEIARWLEKQLLIGDHANSRIDGLSQVTLLKNAAAASTITADELIDTQGLVKDAFQADACWIMSPNTRQAIRKLKDNENRYLLNPDYRDGFGYTLLGKPVYVSDNMPDLGANKLAIYYGDMSGLALKVSEELNIKVLREKYATEHAIGVVGYMECDAKIENEQKIAALKCAATDP